MTRITYYKGDVVFGMDTFNIDKPYIEAKQDARDFCLIFKEVTKYRINIDSHLCVCIFIEW